MKFKVGQKVRLHHQTKSSYLIVTIIAIRKDVYDVFSVRRNRVITQVPKTLLSLIED